MSKFTKYILFTFLSAWIIWVIGYNDLKLGNTAGMMSFSRSLMIGMFMPTMGALVAGVKIRDMGWKLNIDKNKKLILFAWLMPTVFEITGAALYFLVFPDDYSVPGAILEDIDPDAFAKFENDSSSYGEYVAKEIFYSLTSFYTFVGMIFGLGEEIGWRGYLFPELKSGFGRTKAMLLGGTIHGAWHFPLMILVGYEYGTDYIGAPLLGMAAFCIFCIATGIISYWLYERSESILLSGIFHGSINGTFNPCLLRGDEHIERSIFGPSSIGLISVIPMVIFAVYILCTENKRDNTLTDEF